MPLLPASKARAVLQALGAMDRIATDDETLCRNGAAELEKLLKGTLPGESAASYSLLVGVGNAIGYLHSQNVVHGDIKTQNILIARDGTPKLADFGIAHTIQSTLRDLSKRSTIQGGATGTVGYMAPELFTGSGQRSSKASDMFAFGVVIAEVMTGKLPFAGVPSEAIYGMVKEGMRPELPSVCDPEVEKVVRDAWLEDPAKRPTIWPVLEALVTRKALTQPAARFPTPPQSEVKHGRGFFSP